MSVFARGTSRVVSWLRWLRILPREPAAESLGRELRINALWVVIISVGVLLLEQFGWLTWLENSALDRALSVTSPRPSDRIYLIEIGDQDYNTYFGGRSPLDPAKLKEILAQIARAKPAVIGVDFDTTDKAFRGDDWPRAVWAREAEPICEGAQDPRCVEADRFLRLPVLGGSAQENSPNPDVIETDPRSGIVLLPRDSDGVVRRYQRSFETESADPATPRSGQVDSFPRAIVKAYEEAQHGPAPMGAEPEAEGEHLILNFTGDRYDFPRMSLGQAMQASHRDYWTTDKSPLHGRIVLIGGTYRAARDDYFTPVGLRAGVEIVAQAVESELSGGGIRPVHHAYAFAIDILAGFVLVSLNWRIQNWRSRWLVWSIDFLFIAAVSLVGSFLSFRALGHWFNFTAVLLGVLVHLLIEGQAQAREKLHKLEQETRTLRRERDEARAATVRTLAQ